MNIHRHLVCVASNCVSMLLTARIRFFTVFVCIWKNCINSIVDKMLQDRCLCIHERFLHWNFVGKRNLLQHYLCNQVGDYFECALGMLWWVVNERENQYYTKSNFDFGKSLPQCTYHYRMNDFAFFLMPTNKRLTLHDIWFSF